METFRSVHSAEYRSRRGVFWDRMSTFVSVNDELLSHRIANASSRVVFIGPALSLTVVQALCECFKRPDIPSITIVLDPDEEAYRLGYGDREGLELLQRVAKENHIGLRSQPGLRIGLLITDQDLLIWSPTAAAVEADRNEQQPNGLEVSGSPLEGTAGSHYLVDKIRTAVGSDDSTVPLQNAEVGRNALTVSQVANTIELLKQNPPTPFDLARKTRVFSTKFQFVETELRGAAWTSREIKLSSLQLNPDVPDELQELFETRVRPFSTQGDVSIDVPALVQGQVAFNRAGQQILSPMTQADIEKSWKELLKRYLRRVEGFGWLIQRGDKAKFESAVKAYETVLQAWVEGFRQVAANDELALVKKIVELIKNRAERSAAQEKLKDINVEATVREGIRKLRVTEPSVKLVFKEISWESTKDSEFTDALHKALPAEALEGWFEVFSAARERGPENQSDHKT
jgi:hypothetical protein